MLSQEGIITQETLLTLECTKRQKSAGTFCSIRNTYFHVQTIEKATTGYFIGSKHKTKRALNFSLALSQHIYLK